MRRERLRVVVGERHRLSASGRIDLPQPADERLELWPRDMAPGYYDAIVGACRAAGFEPTIDEHGAGSTVWGGRSWCAMRGPSGWGPAWHRVA